MADREDDETDERLSPWEQSVAGTLRESDLPRWEHKAKAAHFAQGHRGLLDLDLDFPAAHLKGEARVCYVWTRELQDTERVHVYVDTAGECFHVVWTPQSQGHQLKPPTP